jgi:hypothetical protein
MFCCRNKVTAPKTCKLFTKRRFLACCPGFLRHQQATPKSDFQMEEAGLNIQDKAENMDRDQDSSVTSANHGHTVCEAKTVDETIIHVSIPQSSTEN